MGKLLRDIYCMDIEKIILLMTVGTYGFLRLEKKFDQHRFWRRFKFGLMLVLLIGIAHTTLGNRDSMSNNIHALVPFHSYREVLNGGNPEIYRSNFMNVVLFYPAGLLAASLLPGQWPGWCRCVLVVLVLAAMSAGIEYLQYRYALGRCEIDDVIHNTAGALLGSLAALWAPPFLAFLKERVELE